MNLFTKQKQTHRLRKQIYGYQREKVGGEKGERILIAASFLYHQVSERSLVCSCKFSLLNVISLNLLTRRNLIL